LSRSLSYLFYRFEKFVSSFSPFGCLNLIRILEKEGFGIAESYALGVSIAVVTFHRHSFLNIKEGMVEGAGHDASFAADA
jgi:hypothetical protein